MVARRSLAAFATITKIIPPAFRRSHAEADDPRTETKVVFGDYYAALAGASMMYGSSRSRPWPIERAVADGFERIIWVYKSVETIAGQASRLKFELHQGDDVVDDHPLYQLLNTRANPMETGRQFRSRLGKQILLSKRGAFVEVTRARNGTPLRLDLLPPGRTRPVPGSLMSVQATGKLEFRLIDHYETVRADGTRSFIPAEEVIWFREPHPIDPYSGVTPLESAGMSVELDFFARLYNTTFMRNDARPGGIVGINGDMDDDDMKKLEETFARGPAEAGKLTVVAGEVSYVDSVVRPRDAQHGQTSDRAKIEILDAFGCPESMFGNAGGRTFDNAGQEGYNFWTITMAPFLDLQVTGVDELSEPELEGFFDVSQVPALAAAEAAKRAEARTEKDDGSISIDEYRIATGKEPYNLPATRALIVANGTTLIPTSEADQKALGGALVTLGQPPPAAPAAAGGAPDVIGPASTHAAIGASPSHPAPGHRDTGPAAIGAGQPGNATRAAITPAAPATKALPVPAALPPVERPAVPVPAPSRVITACQVKAGPRPRQPATPNSGSGDESDGDSSDADAQHDQADQQAERLEAALALVLAALAARWAASGLTPDPVLWQSQAQAAVTPLIMQAATIAAARAHAAIGGGAQQPPDPAETEAEGTPGGPDPGRDAAGAVIAMVGTAAAALALKIAAVPGIDIAREAATWAAGIAVHAATATVNAAADLAATIAARITGRQLVRVWRTRRDTRVRPTHRAAEGQRQPPGAPFIVGGEPLMYPGDPAGSLSETAGCRCRLTHKLAPVTP